MNDIITICHDTQPEDVIEKINEALKVYNLQIILTDAVAEDGCLEWIIEENNDG